MTETEKRESLIRLKILSNSQVEVALLTDPDNQELSKLKRDLEEVIELTRDLISSTQCDEAKKTNSYVEQSADADLEAVLMVNEQIQKAKPARIWRVGDKCMAKWAEDKQYYEATIEAITSNEVSVVFDAYQNRGTSLLKELKECVVRNEVFPSSSSSTNK